MEESWAELIRDKAEEVTARDYGITSGREVSTLDLVTELYPSYVRPDHLLPMVELFERAWVGATHGTIHAPPQHGKTTLGNAFVIATLLKDPTMRIVYATYEAHRAWRVSAEVRRKAIEAGVELDDAVAAKDAWQTKQGGQFIATGVGGPLVGEPADIILIDDPYKNRQQALSAAYQELLRDWFFDVVESRTHKGSSIFVHHTRWHTGDLIGWIHDQDAYAHYESVVLPAVYEDGSILWPYRHSAEELLRRQVASPDQFEGLYQGRPPLSAGKIFPLATYCPDDFPTYGCVGLGMDAAYTQKSRGDSCALVVLREVTEEVGEPYYVVELARRERVPLEEFEFVLRSVQSRFKATPFRWSGSSIEGEIARRLNEQPGIWIDFQRAINDKLVRSEPAAIAWRQGRIRIPEGAEFAADFVDQVTGFTGVEGRADDYVDALADAFAQVAEVGGLADYLAWIKDV